MLDVTEKINADISVTALPLSYAEQGRGGVQVHHTQNTDYSN